MVNYSSPIRSLYQKFERNQQLWLRALAVISVLGASVIVGREPSMLYLLPFIGLLGVSILSRVPAIGLLGIIVAAMVVPLSIGTGTGSSINAPMLVLVGMVGLWILDMVARQRQISLANSRTLAPLAALCAVAILAFFNGQLPWFTVAEGASISAQIGGLAIFLLSALAYLWMGHQIRELRWLKLATWLFLALGSIHVFGRILPFLRPYAYRLFQHGLYSGSLFWTWLLALAFAQMVGTFLMSFELRQWADELAEE